VSRGHHNVLFVFTFRRRKKNQKPKRFYNESRRFNERQSDRKIQKENIFKARVRKQIREKNISFVGESEVPR
jgi:hypothetical protein